MPGPLRRKGEAAARPRAILFTDIVGSTSYFARHGDRAQALAWLEKANQIGAMSYVWFESKDFQVLHGDPRYEAVLKSLSDEYKMLHPELVQVYAEIQR
jgi:hypothetical protein